MTAEVIVDIAHSEVDRVFEYISADGVKEGSRVRVPFGGRAVEGYVMRLKEGSSFDPAKLKAISSVVDEPLIPECLSLARALSERYRCPMAQVLRLFLPAEMRRGAVRELYKNVAVFVRDADIPARAKAQAAALAFLKEKGSFPHTEKNSATPPCAPSFPAARCARSGNA